MDGKIIGFVELLRRNEIPVSTAEVLDALRALSCIPISDREVFRQALCSSLIKDSGHLHTFGYLFGVYFSGLPELLRAQTGKNLDQTLSDPARLQDFLDRLREILEELGIELSPLARALVFRDLGRLTLLIQEAARNLLEHGTFEQLHQAYQLAFQTLARMNWSSVQKEILRLVDLLGGENGNPEDQALAGYLENLLREFPQILKEFYLSEYQKQAYSLRKGVRRERLFQLNFFASTPTDLKNMSEVAHELAEKLKTAVSLRRTPAERGRLQVRTTLRKNLQYGGVPFRIVFDRKKIQKPQIVIVTDISNSMRNASRFMLHLVYSLQELYSRVRSFLFVNDLGEATGLFRQFEIGEAINRALSGEVIDVWDLTNYGAALKKFHRHHLSAVDSKTIFIVLGDGRSNYQSAQEWVLREIHRRARMVIWLNPEPPSYWGSGDSEMKRYLPYCHLVRQVSNLKQLTQVAEELVAI